MKLLLLFISFSAIAGTSYKIKGKWLDVNKKDKLIFINCSKGCIAAEKIKELKKLYKHPKNSLLKSQASLACKTLQGKTIFGIGSNKDMMAFCQFKDKSMVSYQSLEEAINEKNRTH